MTMRHKSAELAKERIRSCLPIKRGTKDGHTARSFFVARMLLTGKPWNRKQLFDALMDAYPNPSVVYTARILERYLPFIRDIGLIEPIGKDQFRIKPKLLALLKEGDE